MGLLGAKPGRREKTTTLSNGSLPFRAHRRHRHRLPGQRRPSSAEKVRAPTVRLPSPTAPRPLIAGFTRARELSNTFWPPHWFRRSTLKKRVREHIQPFGHEWVFRDRPLRHALPPGNEPENLYCRATPGPRSAGDDFRRATNGLDIMFRAQKYHHCVHPRIAAEPRAKTRYLRHPTYCESRKTPAEQTKKTTIGINSVRQTPVRRVLPPQPSRPSTPSTARRKLRPSRHASPTSRRCGNNWTCPHCATSAIRHPQGNLRSQPRPPARSSFHYFSCPRACFPVLRVDLARPRFHLVGKAKGKSQVMPSWRRNRFARRPSKGSVNFDKKSKSFRNRQLGRPDHQQ